MNSLPNQIRLRQNVSRRIVAVKIAKARDLLSKGQNVTFELVFRADEAGLTEQRLRLFGRVATALKEVAAVESQPGADQPSPMNWVMRPV